MANFFNQVWISHFPEDEKDKMQILLILKKEKIGVFQENSNFSGSYDLIRVVSADGNNVNIKVMQTDEEFTFQTKVSDSDNAEFDYMVEITGNVPRGPKKYYTMADWQEDHSLKNLLAILEKLDVSEVH